ncbi:MAG TPA: transcriptional regulator [Sandaracinaceae bacterium LLY-WYZ-13_1]|nr:transcriptional regulator [Sandaracinaceae bacterium LLY-WYZ-13_1]
MRGPKHYRSIEEFEREEIRSHIKLGWSLDDLENEANIHRRVVEEEDEPAELDFDF